MKLVNKILLISLGFIVIMLFVLILIFRFTLQNAKPANGTSSPIISTQTNS